ncbi:hypothetical protein D3C81_1018140 [compost metagenome]
MSESALSSFFFNCNLFILKYTTTKGTIISIMEEKYLPMYTPYKNKIRGNKNQRFKKYFKEVLRTFVS